MTWKFDYLLGDIVFQKGTAVQVFDSFIDFGSEVDGDLEISCGERDNENSVVDQGLRVIEIEE